MRFVIFVRAVPAFEAATSPMDGATPELMADMAAYHEELARAGVLLDGTGLHPSRTGWRFVWDEQGRQQLVEGPFPDARELVSGWTLIQVRDRDEALHWSRRFPNPVGRGKPAAIEVRQLVELDEFEGPEAERFRALEAAQAPKS